MFAKNPRNTRPNLDFLRNILMTFNEKKKQENAAEACLCVLFEHHITKKLEKEENTWHHFSGFSDKNAINLCTLCRTFSPFCTIQTRNC
jgi:tRNA(Ile)-lysidine synthase TilS/MesJ